MIESRTASGLSVMEHTLGLPAGLELVETPQELNDRRPLDPDAELIIGEHRQTVVDITNGKDPRLMVWARPCSLDDSVQPNGTPSALEFADRIRELGEKPAVKKALFVGTGTYFAKPRTGGKGADDYAGLDQRNLVKAHELVTAAANTGVPLRAEVMTKEHIARYGDKMTVLQVGARDVGSTMLRRSLSATNISVFCKNAESGSFTPAYNAMSAISTGHTGVEITLPDGRTARYKGKSPGNPNVLLSYRGGDDAKTPEAFEARVRDLAKRGDPYELDMAHNVAAAHDRGGKKTVEGQVAAFEHSLRLMYSAGGLATRPVSLLLESYLLEGADPSERTPGMSWTDAGIGIDQTEAMILEVAERHAKLLDRV